MNDKEIKCCSMCDSARKSYPVGTCAHAFDCPCHTEKKGWEEVVDENLKPVLGDNERLAWIKSFISQELETARKERDEMWKQKIEHIKSDVFIQTTDANIRHCRLHLPCKDCVVQVRDAFLQAFNLLNEQ